MPPSAGMGSSANIGLRTPPRHGTITPKSRTVMELLRKAAPRCPGTGIVGRIRHLSEEQGSRLDTRDCRRDPGAIPSAGSVARRFILKQISYQTEKRSATICHTDTLRKGVAWESGSF